VDPLRAGDGNEGSRMGRRAHEAPRVMRLRAEGRTAGDCTAPGSGDGGDCGQGNSPYANCQTGFSALESCNEGNNAFACNLAGSDVAG